jgi:hypothetical protein
MRSRRRLPALASALVFVALGGEARADTQMSTALTMGGGVAEMRGATYGAFHLGAHGDVLFGRSRGSDMALGPYAELGTVAFNSFEMGGGLSWLLPVWTTVPFVVSGGAFARHTGPFDWEPGVAGRLFVGSRSYNFHSVYGLSLGGFVQLRHGLGDGKQSDLLFGVHVDLSLLAWPWVYAFQSITR